MGEVGGPKQQWSGFSSGSVFTAPLVSTQGTICNVGMKPELAIFKLSNRTPRLSLFALDFKIRRAYGNFQQMPLATQFRLGFLGKKKCFGGHFLTGHSPYHCLVFSVTDMFVRAQKRKGQASRACAHHIIVSFPQGENKNKIKIRCSLPGERRENV